MYLLDLWEVERRHLAAGFQDDIIESSMIQMSISRKKQNTTISEIFATKGEEAFRDMETETVKELSDTLDNCVISVGGGLVLREVNRELLRKLGTVVYLKASEEELCKRLSKDTKRPLLQGGGLHEKIHNLMEQREDIYLDAADMIVDTQKMSFEQMYTAIIKNMED